MIQQLYIKNFAIIEEIEISFQSGLTIITGETGAGKSILMGALSLILGERADTQSILNPAEKCVIEGIFNIKNALQAKQYLTDQDLLEDDELIIRREISTNGKSRIFINDVPSTLSNLQMLAHLLIDLHRQFDTAELQNQDFQTTIVDEIGLLKNSINEYQITFKQYKNLLVDHEKLEAQNKLINQELDYNLFLLQELESFNAKPNELEYLEQELLILKNSESLKSSLQKTVFQLNDSEEPIISILKSCIQDLNTHSSKIKYLEPIIDRLNSNLIDLKDIATELDAHFQDTNYDEAQINAVEERLNEGNRLLKKHHVANTDLLLQTQNDISEKVKSVSNAATKLEQLKSKIEETRVDLENKAAKISSTRKKHIPLIQDSVNELLKKVGLPNAFFNIALTQIELSVNGIDKIEFQFDANKTGKLQPISKVASGGELSRLMLCIKSMLANSTSLPTLVFDEIDTGISGETAIQVGLIMKQLALKHQLICITHLPQIASKATQHLYIYKQENEQGKFTTKLKVLNDEERVNVLSEMISGKELTESTRKMAKELMK